MKSWKRMGMFTLVLAALAMPSASNAGNFNWPSYPRPERSVPEPGAAALFALGAAVVAARTRKSR